MDCELVVTALTAMDVLVTPYSPNCCSANQYKLKCQNNRVTELYWDDMGLVGNLNLDGLNLLSKVSLAGNTNLTSLKALCSKTSLTWLDVSGISAPLDCGLSNLQSLYAKDTSLNSVSSMCSSSGLKVLDISNNNVSSLSCPNWNLKYLYASNNSFTTDSSICGSSAISRLDLSDNKIDKLGCGFKSVIALNLQNNLISNSSSLCAMNALQVLDVSGNKLTSFSSCLPNLQELSLAENKITNITDLLCSSSKLSFLDVEDNLLTSLPHCESEQNVEIIDEQNSITNRYTRIPKASTTTVKYYSSMLFYGTSSMPATPVTLVIAPKKTKNIIGNENGSTTVSSSIIQFLVAFISVNLL